MIEPKPADSVQCAGCGMIIVTPCLYNGQVWCSERCALRDKEFGQIHDSLKTAHLSLAESLSTALDMREKNTGMHSKRVACHTLLLAQRFSFNDEWLHQVYWGALLHDVGKIGIPDTVLLKEGALSEEEWEVMRTHPEMGRNILADVPFLIEATDIVFSHQEKYDGTGYPQGLSGEEIPLGARLFALVDTLDAITSDRPYRMAGSFEQAQSEIIAGSGGQFDPSAVGVFMSLERELREMVRLKCIQPHFHEQGEQS